MLQPFELFKVTYIERLLKLRKHYLVTQSYSRGEKLFDEQKESLLVSDYEEYVLAKTHWDALASDRYRAIIDLEKPEHKGKLMEMLQENSRYRLFWAVVDDTAKLKKFIDLKYADHTKRYIEQNTNWRIGRDLTLRPSLQLIFGEVFIVLKHGRQTLRVKFEEIEKA
jgi:hypothetical protein